MSLPFLPKKNHLPPPAPSLVQSLERHLRSECPGLHAKLKKSGQLRQFCERKASEAQDLTGQLVEKGYRSYEARELAYQEMYPQSEKHPRRHG